MTYLKPQVEIMRFDFAGFMTQSYDLSSADSALKGMCGGYASGSNLNHFDCPSFGQYNSSNLPTKGDTVPIGNGVYVFVYKGGGNGGHWKCQTV